jgi:serine/threonine protein kinase
LNRIVLDVLRSLAYLHGLTPHAVAHYDLKLDNILVFIDGDTLIAKLCDVNCAKFATTRGGIYSMAGGAAMYMAPEVLSGKDRTVKIDVFSFGIMLAEIVTRYLPNADGSVDVGKEFGVSGRFQMAEAAIRKLHDLPAVAALIASCVAKKPGMRLSSSHAFRMFDAVCSLDRLFKEVSQLKV